MEPTSSDELRWIDEELERGKVNAIHASLASALPGWPDAYPEELRHDIHVCRFLRGHQQDAEKAAAKMLEAVQYRAALGKEPHVAAMREKLGAGSSTVLDLSALPHSDEVLQCLPFRTVGSGASASGLPLAIVPVRLIDPKVFTQLADKIETFLRCMLEARALVLHNLSVEQRRMVKFVELRDFNNVYVKELLLHGRPFITRVKTLMQSVQDHYPELIHQAIIAHAPSTFSNVFSLVSNVLNERMRAKICVVGVSEPFARYAALLDARALLSWGRMLEDSVDWNADVAVSYGSCEFAARWLQPGEALHWRVGLVKGDSVRVCVHWVAAADGVSAAVELHDAEVYDSCAGTHAAPADGAGGIVWLCADNSASWFYERVVRATFEHVARAEGAPTPTDQPAGAAAVELQ